MKETFYVIGEPRAKPRPRVGWRRNAKGNVRGMYQPKSADGWRYPLVVAFAKLCEKIGPISKPVEISAIYYFERPGYHYCKRKAFKVLSPNAPIYNSKKPDRDNLDKCLLDAAVESGFLEDDDLVVTGKIEKRYATFEPPGAMITVTDELGPMTLGEIYAKDMLEYANNPRRIPNCEVLGSTNGLAEPTIIPPPQPQPHAPATIHE
jgi:Holliday junction resolvase RusA-like endonuclease